MMINLDTNILIIGLGSRLKPWESDLVSSEDCCISAIVIWELVDLRKRGRLGIDLSAPDTMAFLATLHVWPVTEEVAYAVGELDFRTDPADQLIAATSIVHDVPLLTRDRLINSSQVVPLVDR